MFEVEYRESYNLITSKFHSSVLSGGMFNKVGPYLVIHYDSTKVDHRFPLHPFILDILKAYIVIPTKIVSNGHRLITLFLIGHAILKKPPRMELF